ncbi:MAG TPA: hypothetical protein VGE20_11120 [Ramlibacter sp.]
MTPRFCCLARNDSEISAGAPTFVSYWPGMPVARVREIAAAVILRAESEEKATALLATGITKVFLGEAALRDAGAVPRLLDRFGPSRLGLHLAVRRQAVGWAFDTESNEDFSVVTPSLCDPAWEVLKSDRQPSGVRADTVVDLMLQRGVESFLVQVDIGDDADLNLCAGMVERLGDKLWMAPLDQPRAPIADWIRYGRAMQLALPVSLYRKRHELLPPRPPDRFVAVDLAQSM